MYICIYIYIYIYIYDPGSAAPPPRGAGRSSLEGSMSQLLDLLDVFHGCKETFCFDVVAEPTDIEDANAGFLDLLAGSSSGAVSKKRPASQTQAVQVAGPHNEEEIDVGGELMNLMKREIEEAVDLLNRKHTAAKRYCPSGNQATPARRVDLRPRCHRQEGDAPSFLTRAAAIMRVDVKPPVPTKIVHVDNFARYVFDWNGPIIMALHTIKERFDLRRVSNFYYTYDFACAFLQAATSGNGSLHKICDYFLGSCKRHDRQLSSLLPRATNTFWVNVFEDLMSAPPGADYHASLLQECCEHDEFRYFSIGATFKANLKIIGQANFPFLTVSARGRSHPRR